jgi:hypothetical protein
VPAAKGGLQAYQIHSFAPRSGLPQQQSVRTNPVGGAPSRRRKVNDLFKPFNSFATQSRPSFINPARAVQTLNNMLQTSEPE